MSEVSDPVILDKEDPNAPPLQLVYPEEGEDEFGRPIKIDFPESSTTNIDCSLASLPNVNCRQPPHSWHIISSQAVNKNMERRYPIGKKHQVEHQHNAQCCCRPEDFRPMDAHSPCSTTITTKSEFNPRQFIHLKGKGNIRYTLESLLSSAMQNELEANETHRDLYDRHNAVNECLAYVTQYLDCIHLESRSLVRICGHVMRSQLGCQPDASCTATVLLKQLGNTNSPGYYWMKKEISTIFNCHSDVDSLMLEYADKKDDFHKAIHNLRLIIDANFTSLQLQKLRKQFDLIQNKFLECLGRLQEKLPPIIGEKTQMLVNAFGMLGEDLHAMANDRNDFSLVCQHLEGSLRDEINVSTSSSRECFFQNVSVADQSNIKDD